ncbi:uncharacterized protein DS421_14g468610 [Arachis hypogaea]|nr:uncharacterized protein DS421_14g468610 [Arachis hypogaea]
MKTVIVCKLHQWHVTVPTPGLIQHTRSQHIFQHLNSPFRLSICLWMICHTKT